MSFGLVIVIVKYNATFHIFPKKFQFRRFSEEVSTGDLVSDVQFEILKLLSEKEDLQRENNLLQHYRKSYIELITENRQLKEQLELLELSRARKSHLNPSRNIDLKSRSEPDGQEDKSCKTRKP